MSKYYHSSQQLYIFEAFSFKLSWTIKYITKKKKKSDSFIKQISSDMKFMSRMKGKTIKKKPQSKISDSTFFKPRLDWFILVTWELIWANRNDSLGKLIWLFHPNITATGLTLMWCTRLFRNQAFENSAKSHQIFVDCCKRWTGVSSN